MKLSKVDALFLYGVLFNFSGNGYDHHADELLERLHGYLVPKEEDGDLEQEETSDEETVEDEEEHEEIEADEAISPEALHDLPALTVVLEDGEKNALEFEETSSVDSISVLLDGEHEHDVIALQVVDKKLILHTHDEEIEYSFVKLPKKWSKTLESGKLYAVQAEDEEEE